MTQPWTIGAEIVDEEGKVVRSKTGLQEAEVGSITFVTIGTFEPGDYRIRLVTEPGAATLTEYPVTLIGNNGAPANGA